MGIWRELYSSGLTACHALSIMVCLTIWLKWGAIVWKPRYNNTTTLAQAECIYCIIHHYISRDQLKGHADNIHNGNFYILLYFPFFSHRKSQLWTFIETPLHKQMFITVLRCRPFRESLLVMDSGFKNTRPSITSVRVFCKCSIWSVGSACGLRSSSGLQQTNLAWSHP